MTAGRMTPKEVGAALGRDTSTVLRLCRAGELPAVRIGSRWSVDRAAVERLVGGGNAAAARPGALASALGGVPLPVLLRAARAGIDAALAELEGAA